MNDKSFIGFYHEYGPYGCFSNWYPAEFEYAGLHFAHSEQFMMFHKVMMFGKGDLASQIMKTKDPARCKRIAGQRFPEFDAEMWEKTCYAIVKRGVRAKFAQNEGILQVLLGTGSALLAECSARDKKWGIGIDIEDPRCLDTAKWRGQNLLGRILMEVREELRQELAAAPDGKLGYVSAFELLPTQQWNMKAGELVRIPQFYNVIHAYSDTLKTDKERDEFFNKQSLYLWEIQKKNEFGSGLPFAGFFEMKQDVYDTTRRLWGLDEESLRRPVVEEKDVFEEEWDDRVFDTDSSGPDEGFGPV